MYIKANSLVHIFTLYFHLFPYSGLHNMASFYVPEVYDKTSLPELITNVSPCQNNFEMHNFQTEIVILILIC